MFSTLFLTKLCNLSTLINALLIWCPFQNNPLNISCLNVLSHGHILPHYFSFTFEFEFTQHIVHSFKAHILKRYGD